MYQRAKTQSVHNKSIKDEYGFDKRTSKHRSRANSIVSQKKMGDAKDELEIATNWRRVFIDIYRQLKWINSFATINNLAMEKILKKYLKEHFELKDNVVDKNIREFITQKDFTTKKELHYVIEDMIQFISEHFCVTGTRSEAKKLLEQHSNEMRKKDAIYISFFIGASVVFAMIGVFFAFAPDTEGDFEKENLYLNHANALLRFCFIIPYYVFASGFCV